MKLILIISVFLFFAGCKKPDYNLPTHVYVCGYHFETAGYLTAKYWKDGQSVNLPGDGSMLAPYPTGIAVSGNDVYVSGVFGIKVGYWKNDQLVTLGDGIHVTYPSCITVSGNDVYVAGSFGDQVAYWKNGQITTLTDSIPGSFAYSIAVSGNDVYIAGFEGNYAVYWKNGQEVRLTDGTYNAWCKGIAVSGNDVYVAGQEPENGVFNTKYWKNGQPVSLNISNKKYLHGNYPVCIAVSGNDVHIVMTLSVVSNIPGSGNNSFIMYWKNGQAYTLTDASTDVSASGIAVIGNDVYISGNEYSGSVLKAKYWRNGLPVTLNDGEYAGGIAVVPE